MRTFAILLVLAITATSCSKAQSVERGGTKLERELVALVRIWDRAMVDRDSAALGPLLAGEFTLSGSSRPEYMNYIANLPYTVVSAVSSDFEIHMEGDTALLTATDTMTLEGVRPERQRFRFTDRWVRRSGRWQCVSTTSNPIEE